MTNVPDDDRTDRRAPTEEVEQPDAPPTAEPEAVPPGTPEGLHPKQITRWKGEGGALHPDD